MKILVFLVITSLIFISCKKDSNDSSSTSGNCSFTFDGSETGTYGDQTLIENSSGYKWFNCSSGGNSDGPEVSIGIKEDQFNGAGTYTLKNSGFAGKIIAKTCEDCDQYSSNNSSTDCEATFTSETALTFKCSGLTQISGSNSINISHGNFEN